ncbi:Ig-like domain-containing protein [Bradyrhizobium sp. 2TAF24]|uniref:Ig-like domain-containing protein n=1 Tax=Bradyrhizobium sp. 2TAF24 TaxID=3233011 RepID=UPI003F8D9807
MIVLLLALVSAARAQTEVIAARTTIALVASSSEASAPGDAVTFTAQVDADRGAVPGGFIDFFDEATMRWLGRAAVASPAITVADLAPGEHPIRAHYTGTTDFMPFIALPSSSNVLVHRVQAPSRLEVSSSPNPGVAGEPLTVSAVVSAPAGTPTGMVTFRDGDHGLMARVRLDGRGRASFTTSALPGGSHLLSAEYEGDSRFARVTTTVRLEITARSDAWSVGSAEVGSD